MKILLGMDEEESMETWVREQGCSYFPSKDEAPGTRRWELMEIALRTQRIHRPNESICLWFPEAGVHTTKVIDLLPHVVHHDGEVYIPTFCEDLINTVGMLILKGEFEPEDIDILLFRDGEINEFGLNEEGVIVGEWWPCGWFLRHQESDWTVDPEKRECKRCGRPLRLSEETWLEKHADTDTYHTVGTVPQLQSSGCFPFGSDCASVVDKGDWNE